MRILPNRKLAPGDPNPWQFWRWMDITGPSEHEDGLHEELYLRRLYILRTPKFGVMLHWIKREDWARDALHDHPWNFWRLVLRGGYTEQLAYPLTEDTLQPTFELKHRWLSLSRFPEKAYHRISIVKPHTITLVVNGPKTNSWGFFVAGQGHVPWSQYVNGAR